MGLYGENAAGEQALPIVDPVFPVSANAIFLVDKLKPGITEARGFPPQLTHRPQASTA